MVFKRAVVVLACLAAGTCCCATHAGGLTEPRVGTVRHTISLPDGVDVTLDAVMVDRVIGSWLFVRDPWPPSELLPVYANASVQKWRSIEVTGPTMTVGGKRIVCATRIRLYVDSRGRPMPPLPKSKLAPLSWPYMQDIPLGISTLPTIPTPPDPASSAPSEPPGSLDTLVGTSATLENRVVSTATGEFDDAFYVQDASGPVGGLRIPDSELATVARGDRVTLTGTIEVDDTSQEAYLDEAAITSHTTGSPPKPVMMTKHANLGGCDLDDLPGVNTPSPSGSPYNKGVLTRCIGRVTGVFSTTEKSFYISDDPNFDDGTHTNVSGIRVSWDQNGTANQIVPPQVGWLVAVTGISSSLRTSAEPLKIIRVLRPRAQNDLTLCDPQDSNPPSVAITSPPGSTWHKASGATSILVSGTATDAETCVVRVDVKIGSGDWQPASYNASTYRWSYTWQNPQSGTQFTVRATDFAGNHADAQVTPTITSATVIYVKSIAPARTTPATARAGRRQRRLCRPG